jgi:hypothetical protein
MDPSCGIRKEQRWVINDGGSYAGWHTLLLGLPGGRQRRNGDAATNSNWREEYCTHGVASIWCLIPPFQIPDSRCTIVAFSLET